MLPTFPFQTLFVFLLIALTSLVFGIIPSFAQGDKSTYECDGLFKGGKKPTVEQLEQIFQEHTKWIESEEKEGTRAKLCGANLTKAHLIKADLTKANLSKAELRGANLSKANLAGATLTNVKNLIQSQLNQACVDEDTTLPEGLTRPAPCGEEE